MRSRYEIWDAYVKFEESDEVQQHPVMILNDMTAVVIALKITTTNRGDNSEELRVKYWRESGLDHESSIRLNKQVRLQEEDFIRRRGVLDDREILKLRMRTGL